MYENLPRLAGIEEQCQYDAACQLLNFFSLSEQVDQILLIFQRLHELLLRNASIWILLKLLEKTLKDMALSKSIHRIQRGGKSICILMKKEQIC